MRTHIEIGWNTNPAFVPYDPVTTDDRVIHPQIDLVAEPHRASEIPEIADSPDLIEFLAAINGPRGLFCTFRVIQAHGADELGAYTNFMLGMHVRDPGWQNDREPLLLTAFDLVLLRQQAALPPSTRLRTELFPLVWRDQDRTGLGLELIVQTRLDNPDQTVAAARRWQLEALLPAFLVPA